MSESSKKSRASSADRKDQSGYTSKMAATPAGRSRNRRVRKQRPLWIRRLKVILAGFAIVLLLCSITFLIIFMGEMSVAKAEIHNFTDLSLTLQVQPSKIVASDGTVLYQVSGELREYAPLSEIPAQVRNAMIAAEDRRFYSHPGVDVWALGRILVADVSSGKLSQGGSTLTMQLAKLVTTKGEKTYRRKIHDMALAMDLENEMTKDRILELYLNRVSFGSHAMGIKAAAEVYFGKPLDKLTFAESAFLARLVRRPSVWNNLLNDKDLQETAIENRNVVLKIMRDEEMISAKEYKASLEEVPKFNRKPPKSSDRILRAPYFVRHVIDVFHKEFPDKRLSDGGYRIETTLDAQMQALAEKEVQRTVEKNRKNKVSTAAFVLTNSEGQILAEVGGVDYEKNQYNMIYQGHRQPGSSFKPYVYATALNAGVVHIDDQLANLGPFTFPAPFGGDAWTVHNSNSKYSASTSLRNAFAQSMNVPAAHVIAKVGPAEVVRTAHEAFGFRSKLEPVLPLVLGSDAVNPLEVAQALSVFALKGDRATPYAITRVTEPSGETFDYAPRIDHNVFNPAVCDQIDQLMRGVVEFGTGYRAKVVPNARGKTGTTNSNRDAWFVGYADGLIGVGWIANERPPKNGVVRYEPMSPTVFGGTVTVEFWAAVMKAAHDKYGTKFATPTRVDQKPGKTQAPPLSKDLAPVGPDDQKKMGPPSDDNAMPIASTKAPPADAPDISMGDDPSPSDDQAADPPQPKPVLPAPPPVEQYVEMEVCVDTGMRASVYCPETITRRFRKGKEPKKVCTKHSG